MSYPNGKTVKYAYDGMNRLVSVKGIDGATTKYSYDAMGRRIATDGAKEDTSYTYDEMGNLISQTTTGAYDLALEYAYDLSGRMTKESRTENGVTLESSYIYDALGQLTGFERSDGITEAYTYDPVGNMLTKTVGGIKTQYSYNAANQLEDITLLLLFFGSCCNIYLRVIKLLLNTNFTLKSTKENCGGGKLMKKNNLADNFLGNKKDKTVETENLLVRGNQLQWDGVLIQISNISLITTSDMNSPVYPLWAAIVGILGLVLVFNSDTWFLGLLLILVAGAASYLWYTKLKVAQQSKYLNIQLNSGRMYSILFRDEAFLKKVFHVFSNIFDEGPSSEINYHIDMKNCHIDNNSSVVSTVQ